MEKIRPDSFETLLEESVKLHGHLCAGQVIGVRMSMLALSILEIKDPKGVDRKTMYVIVEIDRCATDAIQSVTGCSLGKRTMRLEDRGVMAATFVNLKNSNAVRITAKEESRIKAKKYFPDIPDKYQQQLRAYQKMSNEELFKIQYVSVDIPEENLPGKPLSRVVCQRCGDWIQDRREVSTEMQILCRGCYSGNYYTIEDDWQSRTEQDDQ